MGGGQLKLRTEGVEQNTDLVRLEGVRMACPLVTHVFGATKNKALLPEYEPDHIQATLGATFHKWWRDARPVLAKQGVTVQTHRIFIGGDHYYWLRGTGYAFNDKHGCVLPVLVACCPCSLNRRRRACRCVYLPTTHSPNPPTHPPYHIPLQLLWQDGDVHCRRHTSGHQALLRSGVV